MILSLTLPVPPSTNHLYPTIMMPSKRTGRLVPRRVKSAEAKEYEEWTRLAVAAKYGVVTLKPPIRIDGTLYAPDWRGIDSDNKKALYDALGKTLGFDDRRIVHECWEKVVEKGQKPRVEFTIEGR